MGPRLGTIVPACRQRLAGTARILCPNRRANELGTNVALQARLGLVSGGAAAVAARADPAAGVSTHALPSTNRPRRHPGGRPGRIGIRPGPAGEGPPTAGRD